MFISWHVGILYVPFIIYLYDLYCEQLTFVVKVTWLSSLRLFVTFFGVRCLEGCTISQLHTELFPHTASHGQVSFKPTSCRKIRKAKESQKWWACETSFFKDISWKNKAIVRSLWKMVCYWKTNVCVKSGKLEMSYIKSAKKKSYICRRTRIVVTAK